MCGINGIFAYHYAANPIDRAELLRTRDQMAKRGPDASGEWLSSDGRVGLGHRRLSIIDLSDAGSQPMVSPDGKLVVTFNGEIYNYRELRAQLQARGKVFRSQSDTEVLLHLYAELGPALVHSLRGMFAFAIWDAEQCQLFLARDPYGIKPLYYSDDGWTFRFASQARALVAAGGISREHDPAGAAGFYLFGSVPEPFTIWRSVSCLPGGNTLLVDCTGAEAPKQYHSIAEVYRNAETRAVAMDSASIRDSLEDSVRAHLIADVPVGAFLSAGIDSGALVGLMRDAGATDIQTITVGFEEFRGKHEDETLLAQAVASCYETRHTTRIVTRSEFETDLPQIMGAMDQPTIDGVNSWFVSKAARELGLKVAISGLGGDELFGGYPSFHDIPRAVRTLSLPAGVPFLGRVTRLLMSSLRSFVPFNPKVAGLVELGGTYSGAYLLRRGLFMPWELPQVLDRETVVEGLRRLRPLRLINRALDRCPRSTFARVAALESSLYMRNQLLRDTDWASMAHSLEVRVPLVDGGLLCQLAGKTALQGKQLLAQAPRRALPPSVRQRRKSGFTTPVDNWMRQHIQMKGEVSGPGDGLRPWARDWARIVGKMFEIAT